MTTPPALDAVAQVPHGRTARRLEWAHLPPEVRGVIEARLGSRVRGTRSMGPGFTPGFASAVEGEDGSRIFVKAASRVAQRRIASSYAEEARKRALLPDALPAPRLLWTEDTSGWVVLAMEYVDGGSPARPWRADELERCLAALTKVAETTAAIPAGLGLRPLHEDLPALLTGWDDVADRLPDWPHLSELRELAQSYAALPGADHLIHADVRDDNFILAHDGRALLCDWDWPALGPAWQDVVDLLVTAHGDGMDADHLLSAHPSAAGVEREHVDAWLAALCGYMVQADFHPVPASSPFLGVHRRWWAAATWSWLSRRRGWS